MGAKKPEPRYNVLSFRVSDAELAEIYAEKPSMVNLNDFLRILVVSHIRSRHGVDK